MAKTDGLITDPLASYPAYVKALEYYDRVADDTDLMMKEPRARTIALGGNRFKDKWGTPDVVGIWRSRPSDVIKVPDEIVSAEIKLDSGQLIAAFGQACSYKRFSHKSYLVVPCDSGEEDVKRLEALCRIFGIGLILFDATNKLDPDFVIRVSPIKHEPDMFYVNRNSKLVEEELLS